jgi:hypothetical protein
VLRGQQVALIEPKMIKVRAGIGAAVFGKRRYSAATTCP